MRILHVVGSLNRGGTETWLLQVLRHIDPAQYHFDFLVHSAAPGAYDDEVRALGGRIIPCLSPSQPIKYAHNFLRILSQYGPYDCVHSHVHCFSGFVLALAKLARVPRRIAHSHTSADNDRTPLRWVFHKAGKTAIRLSATSGLAVSKPSAASLFGTQWETDKRWALLRLGIDLAPFRQKHDRARMRQSLGLSEEAIVIGHVGRFVEVKNHDFLLRVIAECVATNSKVRALLVGEGPLRGDIEKQASAIGNGRVVRFLGLRSDVPPLMKTAIDVFVFPSLYEGCPLALLEAQAAGLPCVISDRIPSEATVVRSLVTRLSLNAAPSTWANSIFEAIEAPRDPNIPPSLQNYSIEASAARLCEHYEKKSQLTGYSGSRARAAIAQEGSLR